MDRYKIIFESKLALDEKIQKSSKLAMHNIQKGIDKNIKDFYKDFRVWSEFTNQYKSTEGNWETKLFYYFGDHSNFDKDDWRFSKVKDKREEAIFNSLVLQEDSHSLKHNHINDYDKYLEQFSAKKNKTEGNKNC